MRRAALIVSLIAGLLLAGCGIPDNTDVVRLRPGPSAGALSGDYLTPTRSLRTDTTDRSEFARNYLEAAAGDFESATDRVKQFLSPDAAATFKPSPEIKVVQLTEDPLVEPGSPEVKLRVREVGTLVQKGILVPSEGKTQDYTLKLSGIEGQQGLFVTEPPRLLLLSDTALDQFYARRTIYFWNRDHTSLVPDVRYMSATVPSEQQPTEVIDWLTSGPSPWLRDVVEPLPEGTKPIGNVPAISNETLQISLSGQALPPDDAGALDRLQKQLRWSLQPNLPGTLELVVEHLEDRKYTGTDYLTSNAAFREIAEPERFVVYNGQIRRLSRSYNAGQPVPTVAPEDNRGVQMAALSTSGSRAYAALVVNERAGRTALKVGAAGIGERATLRRITLPGVIGRPVWATSPVGADAGTTGLITAGGKLFGFPPDGSSVHEVEWPDGRPRRITAVAVAPDAHRVAIVAGGQLYVAALVSGDDGVQLTAPHVIHTMVRSLTAVDWSSEDLLVVAGVRPESQRVAIMEVSIDGASQKDRLSDLGSKSVTYLTALPAIPARGAETSGAIAYVLDRVAYDEVNPDRIGADDLAEPVANPPAGVLPGAPFFLD